MSVVSTEGIQSVLVTFLLTLADTGRISHATYSEKFATANIPGNVDLAPKSCPNRDLAKELPQAKSISRVSGGNLGPQSRELSIERVRSRH